MRDGRLAVTCYCEAEIVYVPAEDVRKGNTGQCKQRVCRIIAESRREEGAA